MSVIKRRSWYRRDKVKWTGRRLAKITASNTRLPRTYSLVRKLNPRRRGIFLEIGIGGRSGCIHVEYGDFLKSGRVYDRGARGEREKEINEPTKRVGRTRFPILSHPSRPFFNLGLRPSYNNLPIIIATHALSGRESGSWPGAFFLVFRYTSNRSFG